MDAAALRGGRASSRIGTQARRPAAPARSAGRNLADGLLMLAVALIVCVSSMGLKLAGFSYDVPGGTPLEKIHPATVVALAALLASAWVGGDPIRWIDRRLGGHPLTVAFLAAWVLLLAHMAFWQKLPFTNIVDTFLLPVFLFLAVAEADETTRRRLALTVHGAWTLNSLIAVGEFLSGARLIPLAVGAFDIPDWRSSGLYGHPLSNAVIAGCYLLVLILGGGRHLPRPLVTAAVLLQVVALNCFGGRTAIGVVAALLVPIAGFALVRAVRQRRLHAGIIGATALGLPVGALLIGALAAGGFFEKIVERFVGDDLGSARARTLMFELFEGLRPLELLFGPDQQFIAMRQWQLGIEFGIESFWVAFVLNYGLVPTIVFLTGFFLFCLDVIRRAGRGRLWMFLFFFAVASTSNSFVAKTTSFGLFVVMVCAILPPRTANPDAKGRA